MGTIGLLISQGVSNQRAKMANKNDAAGEARPPIDPSFAGGAMADQMALRAEVDAVQRDVTYHPTEAFVMRLRSENSYQQKISFTGRLVAKHQSDLAFEFGGMILELRVDRGDRVDAGQAIAVLDTQLLEVQQEQVQAEMDQALAILAEMRTGPLQTTIEAARADLAASEDELRNLSRQLERQRNLARDGAVSQSELDTITFATSAAAKRRGAAIQRLEELSDGTRSERIDSQVAIIAGIEAKKKLLATQMQKARLTAPYSGYIADTFADQGTVLQAGQPIVRLIQSDPIQAHVGVSFTAADQLVVGSAYPIDCAGQSLVARLEQIVPAIDPNTQTVLAIFEITDADSPNAQAASESSPTRMSEKSTTENGIVEIDESSPGVNAPESAELPVESSVSVKHFPGRIVSFPWSAKIQTLGFWVPNDALTRGQRGLWSVYRFTPAAGNGKNEAAFGSSTRQQDAISHRDSDNKALHRQERFLGAVSKQQVEVLYSQADRSFIRGTIADGDWIISQGAHRLLDGQRVQVNIDPAANDSSSSPLSTRSGAALEPENNEPKIDAFPADASESFPTLRR